MCLLFQGVVQPCMLPRAPHDLVPAQVSDIAIAVREGADAVMLSGETAYGKFPFKSVDVMSTVARRTEASMLSYMVRGCFEVFGVWVLCCN